MHLNVQFLKKSDFQESIYIRRFKKEDNQCDLNNENTAKIIDENQSLNLGEVINSKHEEIQSNIMKRSRESISKMIK